MYEEFWNVSQSHNVPSSYGTERCVSAVNMGSTQLDGGAYLLPACFLSSLDLLS
jgi:hypothetical protein